jgi:DNA polymerase III delta subunit
MIMERLSKFKRFYFFHGEDEYSKMQKVKSLVNLAVTKGFEDFDYHYFEGRGLDAATLVNAASSPPFGSPLRVILLRNFDKVSAKGQDLIL